MVMSMLECSVIQTLYLVKLYLVTFSRADLQYLQMKYVAGLFSNDAINHH